MLLRPDQLRLQVRPCRTRLPFRFGIATMTEAPMLVAELRADGEGGAIHGYAAELLVHIRRVDHAEQVPIQILLETREHLT